MKIKGINGEFIDIETDTKIGGIKMDNQAKATPRPWKFEKHFDRDYFGNIVAQYPDGTWRTITVQLKYGTPEENEANASLIVKAVNAYDLLIQADHDATEKIGRLNRENKELLKACQLLEQELREFGSDDWNEKNIIDLATAVQKARQAIANATK